MVNSLDTIGDYTVQQILCDEPNNWQENVEYLSCFPKYNNAKHDSDAEPEQSFDSDCEEDDLIAATKQTDEDLSNSVASSVDVSATNDSDATDYDDKRAANDSDASDYDATGSDYGLTPSEFMGLFFNHRSSYCYEQLRKDEDEARDFPNSQ